MAKSILDASAVLVYLRNEPGSEKVAEYLVKGSLISAVNWCEVLTKLSDLGLNPENVESELQQAGILGQALEVVPFSQSDAVAAAILRPLSRPKGLSLGDRACLGLGILHKLTVVTADRHWKDIAVATTVDVLR